ncbi:MAG: hypothetical protein ACYTFY_02780 [Planctomycetota bacterium]|jgi:DNA gyrase/topoisomerase IV subunit B
MQDVIPQYLILIIVSLGLAFGAAILWVLYLVKLATNEDRLLRKIMEEQRRREEKRRAEEDKRRKRREKAVKSKELAAKLAAAENGDSGMTPEEAEAGSKISQILSGVSGGGAASAGGSENTSSAEPVQESPQEPAGEA